MDVYLCAVVIYCALISLPLLYNREGRILEDDQSGLL